MPNKENTFEQDMTNLQKMVAKLENGEMPLEEAMKNFEKGTELIKKCREKLAQVETKVETIMAASGK